jgi:predicted MFS family arabinose efflux permease
LRFFAPLSHKPVAALWSALMLVEFGAQIGNFAIVWMSVELLGDSASYMQSLQYGAVLLGAALGGRLFDARDPRAVLVGAYLFRGAVGLCPLLAAWVFGSPLAGLAFAAIGLALAQAQAEPAMQASMSAIAGERDRREAVTALIYASLRVARLCGRAAPGLLTVFMPVLLLFGLNAALILAAALLLVALPRGPRPDPRTDAPMRGMLAGARAMAAHRELRVFMVTTCFTFVAWALCVSLGPALIVHDRAITWMGVPPAGGYSLLLAAYGIGNVCGSGAATPSIRSVFLGQGAVGAGGVMLALAGLYASDQLFMPLMILAMFICGVGAVGHDLRQANIIQSSGPPAVVSALARARMVIGWASMCGAALAAPRMFAWLGVEACVALAGVALSCVSLWAYLRLR